MSCNFIAILLGPVTVYGVYYPNIYIYFNTDRMLIWLHFIFVSVNISRQHVAGGRS